jgi:hypothetical protein
MTFNPFPVFGPSYSVLSSVPDGPRSIVISTSHEVSHVASCISEAVPNTVCGLQVFRSPFTTPRPPMGPSIPAFSQVTTPPQPRMTPYNTITAVL